MIHFYLLSLELIHWAVRCWKLTDCKNTLLHVISLAEKPNDDAFLKRVVSFGAYWVIVLDLHPKLEPPIAPASCRQNIRVSNAFSSWNCTFQFSQVILLFSSEVDYCTQSIVDANSLVLHSNWHDENAFRVQCESN